MNIERGLRRLLVLVTVVLVLAVVAWRVFLSQPSVTCMYSVILADFTLVKVPAPQGATAEQIEVEARRLHPETKNPLVIGDLTNLFPAPDEPVAPESCDATERASARVVRYAYAVVAGTAIALPIAAVLWIAFVALRWVARGFKSAV
jgi:hypothetical protein